MRANPLRSAGLALVIGAFTAACATTVGDLDRLKTEVGQLRARRKAAQRSLNPLKSHHKRLKAGGGGIGTRVLLGKDGILSLAKASLPHRFTGKEAHPKLRGSFTLAKPYDVRIQNNGKVALRMVLTGKNVGIVINGYASHKKKIKAALAAGAILDITAQLTLDRKRNKLFLTLRCTSVHLKKYNDSTYTDAIRKGLNARVFAARKGIALPASMKGKKPFLFSTGNHLVLGREG